MMWCVFVFVLITFLHTVRINQAFVTVSPSISSLYSSSSSRRSRSTAGTKCLSSSISFGQHHNRKHRHGSLLTHQYLSNLPIPFTLTTAPLDVEKTRLVLQIKGDTVNNALFRAELKKELTFFRGCSAVYIQNGADTAEVVTEGKTKKLASFLEWLSALSLSVSQRRPSFQGPSLVGKELN